MKNQNSLDLTKLIKASMVNWFLKPFANGKIESLPPRIGGFKLRSEIKKDRPNKFIFLLGIYENSRGDKAVAKMWQGKFKDFNYHTLQNEANMYKILNKAVKRNTKTIPKKFKDVYIPKIIRKIEKKNSLILLIEHVDGDTAGTFSIEKRLEACFKIVDFTKFLGTQLTAGERAYVSKRTAREYIYLYHLLLVKAIYAHPGSIVNFLKGVPVFLRSIPRILERKQLDLVHRDLNFENIIISKKQITVIDLQFCLFSDVMHELVKNICVHWDDEQVRTKLLLEINLRYGHIKDYNILIRGLMVNTATHSLTASIFTKEIVDNYIGCLDFAVKAR